MVRCFGGRRVCCCRLILPNSKEKSDLISLSYTFLFLAQIRKTKCRCWQIALVWFYCFKQRTREERIKPHPGYRRLIGWEKPEHENMFVFVCNEAKRTSPAKYAEPPKKCDFEVWNHLDSGLYINFILLMRKINNKIKGNKQSQILCLFWHRCPVTGFGHGQCTSYEI